MSKASSHTLPTPGKLLEITQVISGGHSKELSDLGYFPCKFMYVESL